MNAEANKQVDQRQPGKGAATIKSLGIISGLALTILAAVSIGTKYYKAPRAVGTTKHSVVLTWKPSSSPTVTGYNVYRSTEKGGYPNRLTPKPIKALTYPDPSVTSGQTYYYAVTAVDDHGNESDFSKWIQMVVQ
jgi:Fibronectin type III domain